jgi:UTP:GlnB (protein PII) uridylyltransferase
MNLRGARMAGPSFACETLGSEIGLDDVAQKISRNGSVGFRGHTKFFERPEQAIRTYFAMRRPRQPSGEKNTLNLILYNPDMLLIKAPHA